MTHIVATAQDVTERRQAADALEHLAYYDPVTDLPNRTLMRQRAQMAIARSRESGKPAAAIVVDLHGLRQIEIDTLREFAANNRVLLTLRSRAVESIRWIEEFGAYMKPEQIKIKTVNWIDVEYLGYKYEEIGGVIVRKPPLTAEEVAAVRRQLANDGITEFLPNGKRNLLYREITDRLQLRRSEWTTGDPQNVKDMFRWGQDGKADFEWNWRDNLVDPTRQPNEAREVGFRMRHDVVKDARGKVIDERWIPEVDPEGTGSFHPITGDVDFVSLTDLTSSALTEADHIQMLKLLRDGPLKTPHADSITWVKNGKFDFPKKRANLPTACCLAQFGPDGVVRAVKLHLGDRLTQLISPERYWLYYEGGYQLP